MASIQILRLTTAQRTARTAALGLGDYILDTDTNSIYLGDDLSPSGLLIGGVEAGIAALTGLSDTPTSYEGQGLKYLRVKSNESGIEFADVAGGGGASDFLGLTDTPSAFAAAGLLLRVNAEVDGLELFVNRMHEMANVHSSASSAANGYVLAYDTSDQMWKPAPNGAGATTFTGLTDTGGSLGSAGQFARMVSGLVQFSDADLNSLSDVTLGALPLAADHVLVYDGLKWINNVSPATLSLVLSSASWNEPTMTITLEDDPTSVAIPIDHALHRHSDMDVAGAVNGSVMYRKDGDWVVTGAPTADQALKWNGTDYVYEDVLIMDLNKSPDQTVVADGYQAGTLYAADDAGDSVNPVPPGPVGKHLRMGSDNLPNWYNGAYQFTDRTAAVAFADWASAEFPCIMVIEQDKLLGESDLAAVKQAWLLLAAPSATADVSNEIPLAPRSLGDDGFFVDAAYQPFPEGTHAVSNALARLSKAVLVSANAGTKAYQKLLPQQGVVGTFDIPTGEITASTRSDSFLRVAESCKLARWKVQVLDPNGDGEAAGAIDVKLSRVAYDANVSTISDLSTTEMTVASGARSGELTGIDVFEDAYVNDPGLLREDDRIYATFGTNADNTHPLRVVLYGYILSAPLDTE